MYALLLIMICACISSIQAAQDDLLTALAQYSQKLTTLSTALGAPVVQQATPETERTASYTPPTETYPTRPKTTGPEPTIQQPESTIPTTHTTPSIPSSSTERTPEATTSATPPQPEKTGATTASTTNVTPNTSTSTPPEKTPESTTPGTMTPPEKTAESTTTIPQETPPGTEETKPAASEQEAAESTKATTSTQTGPQEALPTPEKNKSAQPPALLPQNFFDQAKKHAQAYEDASELLPPSLNEYSVKAQEALSNEAVPAVQFIVDNISKIQHPDDKKTARELIEKIATTHQDILNRLIDKYIQVVESLKTVYDTWVETWEKQPYSSLDRSFSERLLWKKFKASSKSPPKIAFELFNISPNIDNVRDALKTTKCTQDYPDACNWLKVWLIVAEKNATLKVLNALAANAAISPYVSALEANIANIKDLQAPLELSADMFAPMQDKIQQYKQATDQWLENIEKAVATAEANYDEIQLMLTKKLKTINNTVPGVDVLKEFNLEDKLNTLTQLGLDDAYENASTSLRSDIKKTIYELLQQYVDLLKKRNMWREQLNPPYKEDVEKLRTLFDPLLQNVTSK